MTTDERLKLERLEEESVRRIEEDEARRGYVKLDADQLLCLMTSILVAGKCFQDQDNKSVFKACCLAQQIFERIVVRQEYTDYDSEEVWPE